MKFPQQTLDNLAEMAIADRVPVLVFIFDLEESGCSNLDEARESFEIAEWRRDNDARG